MQFSELLCTFTVVYGHIQCHIIFESCTFFICSPNICFCHKYHLCSGHLCTISEDITLCTLIV